MDERIEKAFEVANYMATLSNQRRLMLEEFNQNIVFYLNGGTFKITPELISLVKTWVDLGKVKDQVFIDENNFPILVDDVESFYTSLVEKYSSATIEYHNKFTELKIKRKISAIVEL